MPHIKYMNSLFDLKMSLHPELKEFNKLKTYQYVDPSFTKEQALEEFEALVFLLGWRSNIIYHYKSLEKPEKEIYIRLFKRYERYIDEVFKINKDNVKKLDKSYKDRYKLAVKDFECIQYYLFKFEKDAFYNSMPNRIMSFNEKYSYEGGEFQ